MTDSPSPDSVRRRREREARYARQKRALKRGQGMPSGPMIDREIARIFLLELTDQRPRTDNRTLIPRLVATAFAKKPSDELLAAVEERVSYLLTGRKRYTRRTP